MLIKIWNQRIGDDDQANAVSARELHAFLGVRKDFTTWFKDQAFRAKLIEGKHFIILPHKGVNSGAGRPQVDYLILMESAKHIAMMSGTDKGCEVRDYFVECERRAHATVPTVGFDVAAMLANPATMLKLIGGYCQQIVDANECIAVMEPKVHALERITASEGSLCFTDAAKALSVTRTFLIDYLSKNGWIYRRDRTNHKGILK